MEMVLVPYPAHGHVTPMLQLARALQARGFRPILVLPDFIHGPLAAQSAEPVELAAIPSGLKEASARDFRAIDEAMERRMPAHLENLLRGRAERVYCVVVDLLASWAIDVAVRCSAQVAGFWPAMGATHELISAIPELIRRGFISECGTTAEAEEDQLLHPGRAKLSTKDLPWLVGNSASQKSRFAFWRRTFDRANTLKWLLINSFPEEEAEIDDVHYLQLPSPWPSDQSPKIIKVGPLLSNHSKSCMGSNPSIWNEDKSCIEWLDKRALHSVIYVSLGSWVGPICPENVAELALALEAAQRPFLWVLREDAAWRAGLPDGYLDRISRHGKMVAWAPQETVLEHRAVGCYLTHCGWNSTLEAIRHGKRLLCYPISGDQFVNCAYIVRVWGIGVRPNGVGRKAVCDGIQRVMVSKEGEDIQRRVLSLRKRVMGEEGSFRAGMDLQCFINGIKNKT